MALFMSATVRRRSENSGAVTGCSPRTFVQHLIEREGDLVWDLIENGAVIYVCGNANRWRLAYAPR